MAKAAQAQFEQFTAAMPAAFKDGMEKSLAAIQDASAQGKSNMEALTTSVTIAAKGAEALGAQSAAYSKSAVEGFVAQAQALGSARSLQEVIELQTTYAKSYMETFMVEMNRTSDIVSATVKDSMSPLSARATAMAEKLQVAR